MIIDKHNQGWAEYTNNLEKAATRRKVLLLRATVILNHVSHLLENIDRNLLDDITSELAEELK